MVHRVAIGLTFCFVTCFPVYSCGAEPRARLRAALESLEDWLATSPDGAGWQRYLKTSELGRLAGEGGPVEVATLDDLLVPFESGQTGLDSPKFAAVRQTLRDWKRELTLPAESDLPGQVRGVDGGFRPVTPEELAAAQQRLAAALADLDRWLAPDDRGWRQFLSLDALVAPPSGEVDSTAREDVAFRLATGHPGLELPPFVALREALNDVLRKERVALDPEAEATYGQQIERLAAALERFAAGHDVEDGHEIGEILGWLEDRGQAAEVVQAVRDRYWRENLLLEASGGLVDRALARELIEPAPVDEWILGTHILGTGTATATVRAVLVPDPDRAVIDAVLSGQAVSTNTGYNGPAEIYGTSTTQFTARARTFVTPAGPTQVFYPATIDVDSQTVGLEVFICRLVRGLGRRIAAKRVERDKPKVERIAAQRAARRVEQRLRDEAGGEGTRAADEYRNRFLRPLMDRGAFPPRLTFLTTRTYLQLSQVQATPYQIGPGTAPPEAPAADLTVRVHESLVENYAAAMLSGETIDENQSNRSLAELRGEPAPEIDPAHIPWEFTFAVERPVSVRFAEGGVRLTIRGERFKQRQEFEVPMDITVAYALEPTPQGLRAVRQGDIEVFPPGFVPGQDVLSRDEVTLRRQLTDRLQETFQPELLHEGLTPPGPAREKLGTLSVVDFSSQGGWLMIGYRTQP
jgi:hypothetical protein